MEDDSDNGKLTTMKHNTSISTAGAACTSTYSHELGVAPCSSADMAQQMHAGKCSVVSAPESSETVRLAELLSLW